MGSDDPDRDQPFSHHLGERIHERRVELTRAWLDALEERIGADEDRILPSDDLLNDVPALIGRIAQCVSGIECEAFLDADTRKEVSRIASLRRRQGFGVQELLREYEILAGLLQEEAEASAASYEGHPDLRDAVAATGRLRAAVHQLGTQTARSYRAYALRYERENTRLLATYGEMLSHELGNRLGAAETAIKLLRSDMVLSDQQRNRLEELILEGIDRGLQAVQDVRVLASPDEGGAGDESDHRISLRLLMKESVRQAKVRAAKGDVRLELSSDLPDVHVPAAAVRLVLANLVGNAVKYHHAEGDDRWVKVTAAYDGKRVRIEVEDNGPGIPEEERTLIFEQRYRGDEDEEGSGLGLAIAGDAVARLRGDIWVEDGEGGGARFVFILPLESRSGTGSTD